MFETIRTTTASWFQTAATLFRAPRPDALTTFLVIGDKRSGKSTFLDQVWAYLWDDKATGTRRLVPQPSTKTEKRDPKQFPPSTEEVTEFDNALSTPRGSVQVRLSDRLGAEMPYLREDAANDNNKGAREFHEAVNTSRGLVVVFGPETVLADPAKRAEHLNRMVDRVIDAAQHARDAGRTFHLFVGYSKIDRSGEAHTGNPRLFATPAQRAARAGLWDNKTARDGQRTAELASAVADDPTASPGGRALRHKLIEATALFYDRIGQVTTIEPRFVQAYLVQAKPSLPSGRALDWREKGVEPFVTDLTDAVYDRYRRPMAGWLLLLATLVAVAGVVLATKQTALAADAERFTRNHRLDLQDRTPGALGHDGLNRDGFDTPHPVPALDQPGRLAFLMRTNGAVAALASDLSAHTEPALGQPLSESLARLRNARAARLDWAKVFPTFSPREVAAGQSLNKYVAVVGRLDGELAEVEGPVRASLEAAEAQAPAFAQRFEAAARFAAARSAALAAVAKLRASDLNRQTFVRSGGGRIDEQSLGGDVVEPWCRACERLLGGARQRVVDGLKAAVAADPAGHREWLYDHRDADLAFLDDLGADVPRNPFARSLVPAGAAPPVTWAWAETDRVYAFLRVRELSPDARPTATDAAALPVYDIDVESQAVFPVVDGERHRHPLAGASQHGALAATGSAVAVRAERLEVIGVYLKARKSDGFQLVPLKSRGDAALWLPALLARIGRPTPALVGAPAGGDPLAPEWERLVGTLGRASQASDPVARAVDPAPGVTAVDVVVAAQPSDRPTKLRRTGGAWQLHGGPNDPQPARAADLLRVINLAIAWPADGATIDPADFATVEATVYVWNGGAEPARAPAEPLPKEDAVKLEFGRLADGVIHVRRSRPGRPADAFAVPATVRGESGQRLDAAKVLTTGRLGLLSLALPPFDAAAATRITVSGKSAYSLKKSALKVAQVGRPGAVGSEEVWVFDGPEKSKGREADAAAVVRLLNALGTAEALFVVDENPADLLPYSLATPQDRQLKVVIGFNTVAGSTAHVKPDYAIEFGNNTSDPNKVYVRVVGRPMVVAVDRSLMDALAAPGEPAAATAAPAVSGVVQKALEDAIRILQKR